MAVAKRIPIGMGLTAPAVPKLPALKTTTVKPPATQQWQIGATPDQVTKGARPQFTLPTLEGLIQGNPSFAANYAGIQASLAAALAQRQGGSRQLWVAHGEIPDFEKAANALGIPGQHLDWIRSDLTPEIRDLAAKNTAQGLSTVAKLKKAETEQMAADRAGLAARNIIGSGAATKYARETAQKFQEARSTAEQRLMEGMKTIYGGYAANEVEEANRLAQAQIEGANEAYERWWTEVGQYGAPETTIPGRPGTTYRSRFKPTTSYSQRFAGRTSMAPKPPPKKKVGRR